MARANEGNLRENIVKQRTKAMLNHIIIWRANHDNTLLLSPPLRTKYSKTLHASHRPCMNTYACGLDK